MYAPEWTEVLLALCQVVLQFACILFLPTLLIRALKKDLGYLGAFIASCLLILLPLLSFFNNWFLVEGLWEDFAGWGITEIETFAPLSWGLTAAGSTAAFFSSLLLIWTRGAEARRDVLLFLWASFLFNLFAQTALPAAFFGEYGLWLAKTDLYFLAVYGLITALSSWALTATGLSARLYGAKSAA
jgi:hypothetical protein